MTRTRNLPHGPNHVDVTERGLTLKVMWPVVDDGLFDREAMAEAQRQWPGFVELHGVRIIGAPHMRVVELDDRQRQAFGASRAVICEAPATPRNPIDYVQEQAA